MKHEPTPIWNIIQALKKGPVVIDGTANIIALNELRKKNESNTYTRR